MKSPLEVFAAIVVAVVTAAAIALGTTMGLVASWSDALASDKPSACYTIADHLLVVDNQSKSQKTAAKVFIWTHPDDPKFQAFYLFAKNSPGEVGLSIYYAGCSHPLPDGTAYAAIKINKTILKNLAASELVFDTGEVGQPEADGFIGQTY